MEEINTAIRKYISLFLVELLYSNTLKWGHLCIQWNSSISTPWNEDTSVYSGTPLFQTPWNEDTSVYSGTPLFQTPWNEDTSVYSGTPLFQTPWNEDTSVYSELLYSRHPEMRTPLYTVELLYSRHPEMRTPLYTVELLYSNPLKWGHLCIQWNSSIPTPWNEDTSVYSGTPLFQTPWNEDTSVYSGTPLFQHPEMRTPLYTVELLYSNTLKWVFRTLGIRTSPPEMKSSI